MILATTALTPSNMMLPSMPIIIGTSLLLAIALLFYGWLARRILKKTTLPQQPFTLIDVGTASVLAAWLVWVVVTSFGIDQDINLSVILLNCVVYICLVSGIMGALYFRHRSPIKIFGLRPKHPSKIVKTALLWLIATYPLLMISQSLVQLFVQKEDDAQSVVLYFLNHPAWQERLSIIFMAVIIAPIAEEVLFRGYLYGVVRRFAGRLPAMIVTSLLFAAMHLHLPSMLGLAVLATMLCLIYERTGSLWANIVVHATFNAISIIMLLIFKDAVI